MLFLVLKRFVERNTMAPRDARNDEYVDYVLPIDLLGPFERHDSGTLITLRNGMGYVIVKETIDEIKERLMSMMRASE